MLATCLNEHSTPVSTSVKCQCHSQVSQEWFVALLMGFYLGSILFEGLFPPLIQVNLIWSSREVLSATDKGKVSHARQLGCWCAVHARQGTQVGCITHYTSHKYRAQPWTLLDDITLIPDANTSRQGVGAMSLSGVRGGIATHGARDTWWAPALALPHQLSSWLMCGVRDGEMGK